MIYRNAQKRVEWPVCSINCILSVAAIAFSVLNMNEIDNNNIESLLNIAFFGITIKFSDNTAEDILDGKSAETFQT